MTQPILQVKVISPHNLLFQGPALSISSKNSAGNFDILAQHAKFITIIENYPIDIRTPDHKKITFKFPLAVIHNLENKVVIFAQPETVKL